MPRNRVRLVAGVAAAALLAAAAVAGFAVATGSEPVAETAPGSAQIAFITSAPEFSSGVSAGEFYVVNADGSGKRLVARALTYVSRPAWSHDGRQIAFSAGAHEIYVVNADGSGLRDVSRNPLADDGAYTWSPAIGGE